MAGRLPNLKMCPLFGFTSLALIGKVTLATLDSAAAGGTRYRAIGYNTESRNAPRLVPNNQSTMRRLSMLAPGADRACSPV
jgi:hypothetical protein